MIPLYPEVSSIFFTFSYKSTKKKKKKCKYKQKTISNAKYAIQFLEFNRQWEGQAYNSFKNYPKFTHTYSTVCLKYPIKKWIWNYLDTCSYQLLICIHMKEKCFALHFNRNLDLWNHKLCNSCHLAQVHRKHTWK